MIEYMNCLVFKIYPNNQCVTFFCGAKIILKTYSDNNKWLLFSTNIIPIYRYFKHIVLIIKYLQNKKNISIFSNINK